MNAYLVLSRFFQYRSGKNLAQVAQRLKSTKAKKNKELAEVVEALDLPAGDSMNVLNVAEKNDVAKNVAAILGRGNVQRTDGRSKYNKIYTFHAEVPAFNNRNCKMIMTSVSGHLLNYEFHQNYAKWFSCDPVELFDAPITPNCSGNYTAIKQTIEQEARKCDALIIWTDCDREGENIGFEIITVARKVRPNIRVLRAHFSEITGPAIFRALNRLTEPDKKISGRFSCCLTVSLSNFLSTLIHFLSSFFSLCSCLLACNSFPLLSQLALPPSPLACFIIHFNCFNNSLFIFAFCFLILFSLCFITSGAPFPEH